MKAVLVIDMPDKCNRCPLYIHPQYCGAEFCNHKEVSKYGANKPDWCPLRPLPERMTADLYYRKTPYICDWKERSYGWNECLDEILGETE